MSSRRILVRFGEGDDDGRGGRFILLVAMGGLPMPTPHYDEKIMNVTEPPWLQYDGCAKASSMFV